ncbi:MAG: ornithine carbamoyltransferase [Gammaproteobacteria bacterium]|nr:ornithine carbamoyltransferase [Gammaproteobacteria bacterium]
MNTRHFLSLADISSDEFRAIIDRAIHLKSLRNRGIAHTPLQHRMLALVFDKSSTRTRVSFETGMTQLGGNSMFLSPRDTQLGRGEPIEDTARVLSRMVDAIVVRTHAHHDIETLSTHSRVPVINALTDDYHPCQLLADMQTWVEHRGDVAGKTAAWIGDGNNVCHSWMNAARMLGFRLRIATPKGYEPSATMIERCKDSIELTNNPMEAAAAADTVVTDTWASMGQEQEKEAREHAFTGFIVDEKLMAAAASDAIFMHCLPAYRGSEVSTAVIDGPQSVVWDEAENRLHAQKALLEMLLAPESFGQQ